MNTNRITTFLLGPELSWLLMYGVMLLVIAPNQPPTESGNARLETAAWYVLLLAVTVSFHPLIWSSNELGWWLLRIGISGAVGVCFMSAGICNAIRYHDSRDSGVGSMFVLMIALGVVVLFIGIIGTGIFIRFKPYVLPFYKWAGIILGVLGILSFLIYLIPAPKK